MNRLDHDLSWKWHTAINTYSMANTHLSWMYQAKNAADEIPRMTLLFEMERNGKLAKVHHQCSHDTAGTPVSDNHLSCCMGIECRKCPMLLAFDGIDLPLEQIDQIKAWTCATHILTETGKPDHAFDTSEGFLLTVDDVLYWSNLHESLASMSNDDPDEDESE